MAEAPPAWAIVTPSYRGDLERCRILCRSMDTFVVGNWHHYILVDARDAAAFRAFQSPRRSVLVIESILPAWLHHLAAPALFRNRSLWFSWRTGFMIGWHVQQLVKLQMAFVVDEPGLLFCDSDVFFIRHLALASLAEDGRYRFYRTDRRFTAAQSPNPQYVVSAARRLGLGDDPFPCPSYIDNIVVMQRRTMRDMCARLEQVAGKPWIAAIGRDVIISEYSLYGLFVERLRPAAPDLAETGVSLCKTVWQAPLPEGEALDAFCDHLAPGQVAVGFQSFLGMGTDQLLSQLHRAMDRYARPAA
jgi:hypothetical protein